MIDRRTTSPAAVAATFLALSLVACGSARSDLGSGSGPERRTTEVEGPDSIEAPPHVRIRFSGGTHELDPYTFCYGGGCADGIPPEDLFDVGSPEEIIVEYPLPGWTFAAIFTSAGEKCGRNQEVALERIDEHRSVLRPAGPAGPYDVTLAGRGDQGDLFVDFRWSTPHDGPLPSPQARLAVLADHDGRVDSYGVELELSNLATTPEQASAVIRVRSSEGNELTFDAVRSRGSCWPYGTVYWDGPDRQGLAAAALGRGPFTYEVEVVLDGESYRAEATWPDDLIPGNEPSVRLRFSPALPALS